MPSKACFLYFGDAEVEVVENVVFKKKKIDKTNYYLLSSFRTVLNKKSKAFCPLKNSTSLQFGKSLLSMLYNSSSVKPCFNS